MVLRNAKADLRLDLQYLRYGRKNKHLYLIQKATFFIKTSAVYLNRIGLKKQDVDIEKLSATSNPMAARYLIPWAGEHILKRYKAILEG